MELGRRLALTSGCWVAESTFERVASVSAMVGTVCDGEQELDEVACKQEAGAVDELKIGAW